jgi:hypothetical protein
MCETGRSAHGRCDMGRLIHLSDSVAGGFGRLGSGLLSGADRFEQAVSLKMV